MKRKWLICLLVLLFFGCNEHQNTIAQKATEERAAIEQTMQKIAPGVQWSKKPFDSSKEPAIEDLRYYVVWGDYDAAQSILKRKPALAKDPELMGDAVFAARFPAGLPVIKLLFHYKADIDANDGEALRMAIGWGNEEAAILLMDNNARIYNGMLHYALSPTTNGECPYNHVRLRIVRKLLQKGADPNYARPEDGATPLHLAAEGVSEEVVATLLMYGTDKSSRDKNGLTPVDVAANKEGTYTYITKEEVDNGAPCKRNSKILEILKR